MNAVCSGGVARRPLAACCVCHKHSTVHLQNVEVSTFVFLIHIRVFHPSYEVDEMVAFGNGY